MLLKAILQPFYTAFVSITFVVSVLLAFPFFLVISIGRNHTSRKIIFYIASLWAKVWLGIIGMYPHIKGKKPGDGKYIIIANHISYLDPILIFAVIPGYFRPLGKKEFSKIPLLGFIYKQLTVLVDRSSAQSRAKSMRLMWHMLKRENSILIFPEGTFNETGKPLKEFYDGAFRLAIKTGTDILPVVFPDTVKRWHYSAWWKLTPGANRVEFLDIIPVKDLSIDHLQELKQKAYASMENALRTNQKTANFAP